MEDHRDRWVPEKCAHEIYITRNSIMPASIPLRASDDGDVVLVSEYRTACFIDRDKIRLHFKPPPAINRFLHRRA